jgi:hypothetical protein
MNTDHRVYLMREETENRYINTNPTITPLEMPSIQDNDYMYGARGLAGFKDLTNLGRYMVVGMIKVGAKRLWVSVQFRMDMHVLVIGMDSDGSIYVLG